MLDKASNKLSLLTIVVGTILLFDIGTIISNVYIAPILEGYGLPDIFIYLKTIIFLFIFLVLLLWQNNTRFNITKSSLRILVYLGFFTIIAYFFSLFMYKYVLLIDTASIIRNNILYGNPNLVFDFSAINYKTITYITTIFGGFNSEVILFAEALLFQLFVFKSKSYEIKEEKKHNYDLFLYDAYVYILLIALSITAFLSINIFTFRYDQLGSVEMGISIFALILTASAVMPSYYLYQSRSEAVSKSYFRGTYKLLLLIVVTAFIAFVALFVLNIVFMNLNRGSYRIITSGLSIMISIVLIVKIYLKMSLDNK